MAKTRTSFKKGEIHNPKGRPKREWTWAGVLADAVEEMAKDGTPIKVHIAKALLRESLKGNVMAQRELMNRMDGMPQQQLEHSGEIKNAVTIYKPKKNEK